MKKFTMPLTFCIACLYACFGCDTTSKTENNDTANVTRADTSLKELIGLIEEIENIQPIRENKKQQIQLKAVKSLLSDLTYLEKGFTSIKSGKINYDSGDTLRDFVPRRAKFVKVFSRLRDYHLFPSYFQIDRASIEDLYEFGRSHTPESLQVVRMYPIYDYRLLDYNKYSYAFMWADTTKEVRAQANTKLVVDILDPCPPGNCP
jgi:hypothetical protein